MISWVDGNVSTNLDEDEQMTTTPFIIQTPTNDLKNTSFTENYSMVVHGSIHSDSNLIFQHPRNHPRVGARDENGTHGFVADPTLVRQNMLHRLWTQTQVQPNLTEITFLPISSDQYHNICEVPLGEGWREMPSEASRMYRPIEIQNTSKNHPKLFCVVYTHGGVLERTTTIAETWGWRCDGFLAASNVTVRHPNQTGFGSIDLVHLGNETYGNMWQKTRSILAYLYEHYLEDYDFFHLCGDDVHLVVENYKWYLAQVAANYTVRKSTSQGNETNDTPIIPALHIGHPIGPSKGKYVEGGPGYGLSREALRIFNEQIMDECEPDTLRAAEDYLISRCFQKFGIWETNPLDNRNRQMVQGLTPIRMMRAIRRLYKKKGLLRPPRNYTMVPEEIVSNHTYAWHVMERSQDAHALATLRHHAHLYQWCPRDSVRAKTSYLSPTYLKENIVLSRINYH